MQMTQAEMRPLWHMIYMPAMEAPRAAKRNIRCISHDDPTPQQVERGGAGLAASLVWRENRTREIRMAILEIIGRRPGITAELITEMQPTNTAFAYCTIFGHLRTLRERELVACSGKRNELKRHDLTAEGWAVLRGEREIEGENGKRPTTGNSGASFEAALQEEGV